MTEKEIFSQENVLEFLRAGSFVAEKPESYSATELESIDYTVDALFDKLTDFVTPASGVPKFVLAVGAPGSGKTTYLQKFVAEQTDFVHVDFDTIREEMDLFREAKDFAGDAYAYLKYRNAAMFVGRSLVNRLAQGNFNMAFSFPPKALNRTDGALIDAILDSGYDLSVKVFDASPEELRKATQGRAEKTGREMNREDLLEEQREQIEAVVSLILGKRVPLEVYWRARHDSAPVLTARTDAAGVLRYENRVSHDGPQYESFDIS